MSAKPAQDCKTVEATLRYENRTHGVDHTVVSENELCGEIFRERFGLVGFITSEYDGTFFVLPDGTVEYEPHDIHSPRYEVGDKAELERHD